MSFRSAHICHSGKYLGLFTNQNPDHKVSVHNFIINHDCKTCPRWIQLKFVVAALTMMVLLIPAFGQTTPEEWFDKGVALMNQSKYEEATQAFDKAIELNPQYVEAWAGKGSSLYGSSRCDEALQAYDKTIKLNAKGLHFIS